MQVMDRELLGLVHIMGNNMLVVLVGKALMAMVLGGLEDICKGFLVH